MILEKKVSLEKAFFYLISMSFILWALLLFKNPGGNQKSIFFAGCNDFFADFFNVLRYIDERNPYFTNVGHASQRAYLPISYLIFYPFTVFNDYTHMSLQDCWSSITALMSVIIYTLICVFLEFHSLICLAKKLSIKNISRESNFLIVWAILMTNIFLFSIERGNIILLSAVFINYFLSFYDSENKSLRVFAAFSIALASTLKVYPVVLGFIYFEKKQWKELVYAFIFGIMLTILPFFFFEHGLKGLPQLIKNIGIQSSGTMYMGGINYIYGFSGIVYYFFKMLKFHDDFCLIMSTICLSIVRLIAIGSLILSFFTRDRFLKFSLIIFPIVFIPSNSGFYQGLYIIPLLLIFFATVDIHSAKFNIVFLFFFFLMFTPLQQGNSYKSYFTINYEISNICTFAMWILTIVHSLIQLRVVKHLSEEIIHAN